MMTSTRWYRSLYWKVTLSFAVCFVIVLVAQAAVLLWFLERNETIVSLRGPGVHEWNLQASFTSLVARDLERELESSPSVDVPAFLATQHAKHLDHTRYDADAHPLYVMLNDGHVFTSSDKVPRENILELAHAGLNGAYGPRIPEGWNAPPRYVRPVYVEDQQWGLVSLVSPTPLERLGPGLGYIGLGVLAAGVLLTASLILFPVQRRLRSLSIAARRLRLGDRTARVSVGSGDEVDTLAIEFNRMADALSASEELRQRLLADVSHELSTPLTSMKGYLQVLKTQWDAMDVQKRTRYLGVVGHETNRLERIVLDLLDLAKLEGGAPLQREDVLVENLMGRILAAHERDAEVKQVVLVGRVETGAEILVADVFRLEQALHNLITNAIRHTPPSGRVELTVQNQPAGFVFSISDNGPGIDPSHIQHVFERFYKADPSRPATEGGSGLGLSIVKAIAERHGGHVEVSNLEPSGARFTVTIPHESPAVAPHAPVAPPSTDSMGESEHTGLMNREKPNYQGYRSVWRARPGS